MPTSEPPRPPAPVVSLAARARQAMVDAGFEPDFSPEALAEAGRPAPSYADTAEDGVRDLRGLLWSSIDNDESRDLDQVEYAEELTAPGGDIRLLVGIADVDTLVPRGSATDAHAAHNTVSVYTGVAVFPMLPPALSTDRSSLLADQERSAVVMDMHVDADTGEVRAADVYRARLRNAAKLTYEEVGPWLDGHAVNPPAACARVPGLEVQLRVQQRAAKLLRAFRQRQGALIFSSVEARPTVRDGQVVALRVAEPNGARDLIESFMVAANVSMARFLRERGSPALRRIVRAPARWPRLRDLAAEHGDTLPEVADPHALSEFLARRRTAYPAGFADLSLAVVKLLGPGEYVAEEPGSNAEHEGHFGLAAGDYSHSTAPNRRFVDLVTQRLLKAAIQPEPGAAARPYPPEELAAIAARCTEREGAARKVERLLRKIAAADLLGRHLGEEFDAIVTGASPKGIYARLFAPPAEGRVVRGERGLEVGQRVRLRLLATDPAKGFIDFAAVPG